MNSIPRFRKSLGPVVLASIVLAGIPGTATNAAAQRYQDLRTPESPLVLKAQGNFFVGGETVEQTFIEVGGFRPPGRIAVNQMYVEFMVPERGTKVPVVMVHGAYLSGKSWETTPDGRMGWYEYFVRRGHPAYVVDQVGRARSGFNQAAFNDVRAGLLPDTAQPPILRISDENTWSNFRFGPRFGVPFPDAKFPVKAADEFAKQSIPDLNRGLPSPNPTYKALSDLAIQVKGAVLMTHSQSGRFGVEAALINAEGIEGLVLLEPGNCLPTQETDQQIARLARLPILVVFGDHLGDVDTGVPGFTWPMAFESCKAFIARINAAGGNARMLHPAELGIQGNSHMIMQDRNSLRIADLILRWIDRNIGRKAIASR
jgi:pimeloyl-ACP methyl ester carboxylesterase